MHKNTPFRCNSRVQFSTFRKNAKKRKNQKNVKFYVFIKKNRVEKKCKKSAFSGFLRIR